MRVAIFSDVHDNLFNLEKLFTWCQKEQIKFFICLGDIGNQDTLDYLINNLSGELFIVSGNADLYNFEKNNYKKPINFGGESFVFQIEQLSILAAHTPQDLNKAYKKSQSTIDLAFYGHTHKPWLEKKGTTIFINPGTLGGVFYEATFAVLETSNRNIELKILDQVK